MKIFLRPFLFIFFTLLSLNTWADKLYWVGGSGNFNDAAHWSLQSGGQGGAKTPGASDDVFFDESSFQGQSVINFIGNTEVHDFIFAQYAGKVIFAGSRNEKIIVHGNLKLNAYIDNQFLGDIWLNATAANTNISFSLTTLKGNIYFNGNTNWVLEGNISTNNNSTIYFKQGNFYLSNTGINGGNFIASSGVIINTQHTIFNIENKFVLPLGITFNDGQSTIYAYTKNINKYQVSPNIVFNSSSRIHNLNSVMSACNITLTNLTQPTCPGSCNAVLTFNIPASCASSSNPIWVVWNSGCTAIPTASLTPGSTYTVGGLCGCALLYKPVFTNDTTTQDSSYSPSTVAGIAIADPSPPEAQSFNTSNQPTCFGKCNGKIIMTVKQFFGTAPITATWTLPSGGSVVHSGIKNNTALVNKDTLYNACAGTYTVSLTDANGCSSPQTYTVTLAQPTAVSATVTTTNLLCHAVCVGTISEATSGGTGAITCTLNGLAMPGCSASSLCAGTYTVIATDANGCKDTTNPVITQPPAITFTKNPASGLLNIPCNNVCNGSIGVTGVAGGTGAYSFSWLPAGGTVTGTANSSTYSGLCGSVAGTTYTCTIKDANNCSVTATFTVVSPSALSHTITSTNPKCNIGATGSATVTESGGSSPYTFVWNAPGTVTGVSPTSINSNIGGGTYTVVATDNKGCKDSVTVTLTPPTAVTGTITTTTNPTCPNLNNGQLCVTAGGGTPGYAYTWSPTGGNANCTTPTLTVTAGGTSNYQVTITDANSCTVTVTGTMTSPPQATVTAAVTNPPCAGACNGTATLTPVGGTGPFTYHWSCSGSALDNIGGQCGGTTCNYTVTDGGTNCKYTGAVSFTVAPTLTVTLTPTSLSCSGNCNAQITSNVSGGTPVYTYSWTGTGLNPVNPNASNQVNMCAGSYTCSVTDAHGCVQTVTTSISSPLALTLTLNGTNPSCSGSCDGSILATVTGGTGPYNTSWNPNQVPPNTLNPTNLCAGTYTLNVTDANLCVASQTVTLTDPLPVTVTVTTTSITCSGLCNGSATVVVSGGTPGYFYDWDNTGFGASPNVAGLCVGTHTLSVKDSKGCLAVTQFFNITAPSALTASVAATVSTCNGLCNGGATASASGGTPGYTYSWDGGPFSASATTNTLCVGSHTVIVKDANGCTAPVTFVITPLVNIVISSSSTSVSCFNLCDATATANASGGVPPYNIQWVGANTCNNVVSCTGVGLCSGTQTVIATDVNGCAQTATLSISNPPALTASVTASPTQCFGICTGAATVTPGGGTPVYSISWSTGANSTSINNLCIGSYTATVTDNNGCITNTVVAISSATQFTVTPTLTTPSTCGASDGSISLAISGGTSPYVVTWNNGSHANPLSGIPAGTYTATISDANGCDTTIVYGLSDPTGPTATISNLINVSCFGLCNGSATVSGVGTNPITINWPSNSPSGPTPQTGTNLCANNYPVQVVDGVGCITIANVLITSPTEIIDNATIAPPACAGGTGCITEAPTGGSGAGYSYSWDGGLSSPANNPQCGLAAGVTHTCVITDGSGCSQTYTYNFSAPSPLTVTVITSPTLCSYQNNGSASANVVGGTPANIYTWTGSSGVVASGTGITNVSNLAAGSYTLAVSDVGGCLVQTTFTINAAPAIVPNFVMQDNLCNAPCTGSATVAPTGGTGTYTYVWNTSPNQTTPTISGVCGGNYNVVITDGNNCKDTINFVLTTPTAVTMTVASTDPACFGAATGSATVTPGGGTPTYTVSWSPNTCLNCPVASNLNVSSSPYTITVTDANGCATSQILTLTQPPQLIATPSTVLPNCFGQCNGSITSTITGGTAAYNYTWTAAGTVTTTTSSSTNSNLCAGNYTFIVADANNCRDTSTFVLSNPPQITYGVSTDAAACGQSNGSITISSVNGNGAVTVLWINPNICGSAFTCGSLAAGIYSFALTDSHGCTDTINVSVTNSNGPQVTIAVTNDNCNDNINSGSICVTNVVGVNVNLPYTYSWTPANGNTNCISNLAIGPYISTVIDSLGCQTNTPETITEPTAIQDNPTIVNATCLGINNGSITSSASGGTPGTTGYLYSIDGSAPVASGVFSNLAPGTHTVCITDSVNCQKCFTYNVGANTNILSSVSSTNVNCSSICNGSATLSNVNGGTAPYSITWNDPNLQVGAIASNLCAGSYTATITDNFGCQALQTATIVAPVPISANAVSNSPSCNQCNGTITLAPTGGTPGTTGYVYNWNTGSSANNITNVCAGIYQVNITDSVGCTQSIQIPIGNTGAPSVTVTPTSPGCSNICNGSVTTIVSGGTIPYTYSWPVGGQTTPSINGQCAGTYFVQVKDSLGCIATQSVTISSGSTLNANASVVNPACGMCNGSVSTNVSGGSGNYSYLWSPGGATTSSINGQCAGSYSVIVTDITIGCKDTILVGLNSANGPILSASSTNVLCNGNCNGTATVSASGGLPTYTWSPGGQNTSSIIMNNLCAGSYVVQVTDAAGCIQTTQVTVSQPNALISSVPIVSQPRCNNDCNGSITTIISGGTPVYTYTWNPASVNGAGGNNLCPGSYSVAISDANGCTITQFDTLLNPAPLVITGTVTPASCNTTADGAINTTTTGGTQSLIPPGYIYQWSGGSNATTANLNNILVGNYTVVVTDSRNCKDSANFHVTSTVTVLAVAGNDTSECGAGSITLHGTTSGAASVQWVSLPGNSPIGSTPTVTVNPGLGNTTQYVLIAQNGACTNSDTVSVTSYTLPIVDAGNGTSIFAGNSTPIGGSPTYAGTGTIYWQPNYNVSDTTATNPVVSPTVTTTYTVFVINSNGCIASDTVTVHILPVFNIPNGFSPNGDGMNDTWQIDYIYMFPNCEVEVYNRWGEQLFYSKGYNTPWNGTYNGKPVPVGTYYYIVRLNDPKFPDHYAGPITILR